MRSCVAIIVLFIVSLLTASCVNYGAMRMPPSRENYNVALQNSDKQQILLNIVRIRYSDPPVFLGVNNIITQMGYSNTLTGGATYAWSPSPNPIGFGSVATDAMTVSEGPTITYTPLVGTLFIKKMLAPINLESFYGYIYDNHGSNDAIFRLLLAKMGPFVNKPLGMINEQNPPFSGTDFDKMTALLQKLSERSDLIIINDRVNGEFAIKLTVLHFERLKPKERVILAKLGFSKQSPSSWMVTALAKKTTPTTKKKLLVETRPLYAIFTYLSQSVFVSTSEQGRSVQDHQLPNGAPVNWQFFTRGVLQVNRSAHQPRNPFVAVKYRDYWFYVADNDIRSKQTMYILSMLMILYEGNTQNGLTPVFSILK